MSRIVGTAAAALLLTQASVPRVDSIGVLVGVYSLHPDAVPVTGGSLRTIWFSAALDSQVPPETIQIPHLLVPRKSGFWQMGLQSTCSEKTADDPDEKILGAEVTIADHLWTARAGQRPDAQVTARDERPAECHARTVRCEIDQRTQIFWVWPEYLSLNVGRSSDCGAHPGGELKYTIRRVGTTQPLTISDVFGAAAQDLFRKAYDSARREYIKEWGPACAEPAVFDPWSWHVERDAGQWRASGWASTSRVCGYGFDFTADLDLSALTGRRAGPSSWSRLRDRVPDLTDADSSPDGRWTLATKGTRLRPLTVTIETEILLLGDSDRIVAKVPLTRYDNVVMVEWAVGRHVDRWRSEVRHVFRR